jgi:hypothetical protein
MGLHQTRIQVYMHRNMQGVICIQYSTIIWQQKAAKTMRRHLECTVIYSTTWILANSFTSSCSETNKHKPERAAKNDHFGWRRWNRGLNRQTVFFLSYNSRREARIFSFSATLNKRLITHLLMKLKVIHAGQFVVARSYKKYTVKKDPPKCRRFRFYKFVGFHRFRERSVFAERSGRKETWI